MFNLPVELYLILKKLPSEILYELELETYTIKSIKYLDLVNDIAFQLDKIIKENGNSVSNIANVREQMFLLYIIGENYQHVYDNLKGPNTLKESLLQQIAAQRVHPSKPHAVDVERLGELAKTERKLAEINKQYGEIFGNPKDWIPPILEIMEKDAHYFHNNLICLFAWLRVISIPLISGGGEKAEEIFNRLLEISESINSNYLMAISTHLLGIIKTNNSHLTQATNYFNRSLELSKPLELQLQNASKNNLGIVYTKLGELDKAEVLFQELLPLNHPTYIFNLANTYVIKGENNKAIELLEELDYVNFPILAVVDILHQAYTNLNDIDKAVELEKIGEKTYEKNPVSFNKISLYRMRGRRYHKIGNLISAKEQYNLELEVSREMSNLTNIFDAYIHLIQVQIDLYALKSEDNSVRNQLFGLINTIMQLSDEQGMAQASIELLILRADLLIEQDNINGAKEDLYNARKLANQFEYQVLEAQAAKKLKLITSDEDDQQLSPKDESKGFFDRLKEKTSKLLGLGVNQQLVPEDATVHGLIVIAPGGMSIYSNYLSERLTSEPALISGLISAVSTFMGEIASGKGFLKSIQHDDLSVIMEPVGDYFMVCIADKETFSIRDKTRRFADFVEEIVEKNSSVIEKGEVPVEMEEKLNEGLIGIYT